MDDVITLVKETKTQDANGIHRIQTSTREVFCVCESVSRSEFYEAGRNGLNPEYKFILFFGDYEGERTVIYNGQPYAVYRTYKGKTDDIELYAERKGGTNAQP